MLRSFVPFELLDEAGWDWRAGKPLRGRKVKRKLTAPVTNLLDVIAPYCEWPQAHGGKQVVGGEPSPEGDFVGEAEAPIGQGSKFGLGFVYGSEIVLVWCRTCGCPEVSQIEAVVRSESV